MSNNLPSKPIYFSLTLKITLAILIIVGILGMVSTYIISRDMRNLLLNNEKDKLRITLTEQTHEINLLLNNGQSVVTQLATNSSVIKYFGNANRIKQDKSLLNEFLGYPLPGEINNIYLLDTRGKAILSIDPSYLDQNYDFRNYFIQAIKGNPYVESAIGVTTKKFGIYFSAPIYVEGQVKGVVVVKIDPDYLVESLNTSFLSDSGYLMMVDKNGVVVLSNKPNVLFKSLGQLNEEVIKEVIRNKTYLDMEITPLQYDIIQGQVNKKVVFSIDTIDDKEDNKTEFIGLSKVSKYPFYLMVEEDLDLINSNIGVLVNRIVFVLSMVIFFGSIFMIILVNFLLSPLIKLNNYAKNVAGGNFDEQIEIRTSDEMESLTDSIKEMVTSLQAVYGTLEKKVEEKTLQLSNTLGMMEDKNKVLEDARTAMLNVLQDLDEEKTKISKEKSRIETILSSIGDAVLVTDVKGNIVMMNNVAQDMTGYTLDEARGKYYTDIFKFSFEGVLGEKFPLVVEDAISTGRVVFLPAKTLITSKVGKQIPVLDSAAPLKDVDGKVFGSVMVVRDNTKERELEKSKDDFLSVASHQLRTPLGSMRWNLELLLGGDYGEISQNVRDAVTLIHSGSLRMISLVNDLLNVSRIDQGRVMNEPVESNLGDIVKQKAEELKFLAEREKVSLNLNVDSNLPTALIDPKRFGEVVTNLISNSIKYHTENGWVKVDLGMVDGNYKLTIEDNGIGIPKKDEGRLFEKFFRADNATKSQTEGSGLGLYIAKKFIEGWGGNISAVSDEGKGTIFTIILPNKIKQINIEQKV